MEEWGRRPRSSIAGVLPHRKVPPGTESWEPTDRCPTGECESRARILRRAGIHSERDFDAVQCYHCLHGLCLECGARPTPGLFEFCDACSSDFLLCDICGDRHAGDCCAIWGRGWMLALDTETTGKDPHSAELVSVALVEYRSTPAGEEESVIHRWLVNAGCTIPDAATRVHGISTADVRRSGRPIREALAEIGDVLSDRWTSDTLLCAFNAPYDLTVLDNAFRRYMGRGLAVSGPVVDPQSIDFGITAWNGRRRIRVRNLTSTCNAYRVHPPREGFHDAAEDALAAARLVCALSRDARLADYSLYDLQHRQRSWKGGLEAMFGHPRALVEAAWPLEYPASRGARMNLSRRS